MYKSTILLALAQYAFAAPLAARQDPCAQSGPGVCLDNQTGADQSIFFYQDSSDGNGFGVPSYDVFSPPGFNGGVPVPNGASVWVTLDPSFKGRVQHANAYPSTWVEFQISASSDSLAHGDISLIQGYDGPAQIAAMDGSVTCGFTQDLIIDGQTPQSAIVTRQADGKTVLANTEFSAILFVDGNQDALNWENSQLGTTAPVPAYTQSTTPACVVNAPSQQLRLTFFPGH
ncbi:MAG: hypothetical protein MMC23_008399 [Stictis urceolatum]|nr:hypothetical protein [Stictis urceolata]